MLVESQLVQITRREKIAENEFHALFPTLNKIKLQNLREPQVPIENLPIKIADNIVTSSAVPVPECTSCGACCFYLLCATVKPTDLHTPKSYFWKITLGEQSDETVVDQFMRRNAETMACIALDGEVGENIGCQIYKDRPQVCREFDAGSDKCHAIRRAYGIEQPLSDEVALEANFRLKLLHSQVNLAEKLLYAKIIPHPETEELVIIAIMEDGSRETIHIFNPQEESWLQAEFANLTLLDAYYLIKSRRSKLEN